MMRRVVITGLGAITPIGNNVSDYFDSLSKGVVGIAPITKFDPSDLKVKIAAEVKNFDPSLYMDVPEIKKLDLYSQYAIASAHQAVSDSKIMDNINPHRFGVYMGSGIGGIDIFKTEAIKQHEGGSSKVSANFIPMTIINIASGLIAIRYKAQGPNMAIVTACATGASCIGEAYHTIMLGKADAMIAGGSEAAVNKLSIAGFQNMFALTRRNDPLCASIPFDKRRDGFVLGEGSGALILEELEHAKKRGAKIYAEIVGYGNTCDAHHVTAPVPDGNGAARALLIASETLKSNDNVYINAHGTSTPFNDKTETTAIKSAFGDRAEKIAISSTKSMTGHTLGAAGAIESIASIMAINKGIVPPTMGYLEKDDECDLDYVPNKARKTDIDFALSSSFGFGGQNAVLGFRKYK
ncbi:MAG: beta-ketoacyl-ACP synthase II [Firmicutes bacterium]|nr:beta-ketoacyl-ACP synthase II [Bacillota bacterium]